MLSGVESEAVETRRGVERPKPPLNVLMIGTGELRYFGEEAASKRAVRERHIEYGRHVGSLHILIKTPRRAGLKTTALSGNVTAYPTCSSGSLLGLRDLFVMGKRLIREHKIDLITAADPFGPGLVGYWLKRATGVPLNLQIHSDYIDNDGWMSEHPRNRLLNLVAKRLILGADTLRVGTTRERRKLCFHYGIDAQRIHVVPIYRELERFSQASGTAIRERYRAEGFDQILLCVWRLVPEKELGLLLSAMQRVAATHPKAVLLMVGDGLLRSSLEALADKLGIRRQVRFLGQVPYEQVPSYFQACDLLALSSRREGTCLVLVEAAAAAKPVVATDIPGTDDVMIKGVTGFVVPKKRPDLLAEKMGWLLDRPAEAKRMGEAGRRHVFDYFPKERMIGRLLAMWQATAQASQRRGGRDFSGGEENPLAARVLYVEVGPGMGGSGRYLFTLLKHLDRSRYHSEVVCSKLGRWISRLTELDIPVCVVPEPQVNRWPWVRRMRRHLARSRAGQWLAKTVVWALRWLVWVLPATLRLYRIIRRQRIQIVHSNNQILAHLPTFLAARWAGVALVCHIHNYRRLTWIERRVAGWPDCFLLVSHAVEKLIGDQLPRGRTRVIRSGIDLAEFSAPSPAGAIPPGSRNGDPVRFGIIGRIVRLKGHQVFIHAVARTRLRGIPVEGVIVGEVPQDDDGYWDEVLALIQNLNAQEYICLRGWQQMPAECLNGLDVVVHASIEPEPAGLVLLEAMAAGKPVIGTNWGGTPEIVEHGRTGWLVEPNDPGQMSDAMTILALDPQLRLSLGINGRKKAESEFTVERMIREIEDVYRGLLKSRYGGAGR